MSTTLEYLKEHGRAIGIAAKNGDPLAADLIYWYSKWQQCPADGGAAVVAAEHVKKWREQQAREG